MTDDELKAKYLGKRIQLPWQNTTGYGGHSESTITGICQNIGHNPHLPSWELVVVIDRLPISNVDFNQIKIIEDGREE